jgi:PAS domain S-box-containing protein
MKPDPVESPNQIASEPDAGSSIGVFDTHITSKTPVLAGVRRRDSIRCRLATLVIACVLPVWIVAGFLVYYNYQSRRALTEQRMLDTARALTMVVDRELADIQASLNALATSPSLVSGDMHAFYSQAQAVLESHPGSDIILSDATSQELIHTFLPFGAPLPKRAIPQIAQQVYETGRPVITGLFKGAGTRRLQIAVDIPVFRGGRVVYDLAMSVPIDRLSTALLQQHLPPEWVGRIFDSNQTLVARTRLADEFVGRDAALFLGQMRNTTEGTTRGINFEGVPMVSSFSRSATSGWTVAIGVPQTVMMAEIWRWLWWTLAGTALLSLAGIALALHMARRIVGSIRGLIASVLALGRGESVAIGHFKLTEFNEASESLVKASQLIQQRTAEHERAEAARREAEDLKRLNAELERSEAEARALATELAAIMDAVPAVTVIAQDSECQRMTSNRTGYDFYRLPPGANLSMSAPESERPSNYRMLRDGRELASEELPVQLAVATGCEIRDSECTIVFDDGSSREICGNAVPLLDERGRVYGAVSAFIDITERKRAEEQLRRLNRTLKALNASNQVLLHATDERTLLEQICKIITEDCGYAMVSIDFVQDDEAKSLVPVAYAGIDEGYLKNRRATWSDEERGRGPGGTAIRTGRPCVCRNMLTDPIFLPWREDAIKRGYASALAVPLMADGKALGTLATYAREPAWFSEDEVSLLVELAGNLAHGIGTLRVRAAHAQAEEALRESEERFHSMYEHAAVGILQLANDGRLLMVNQAMCRMLGYSGSELIGRNVIELTHPDDLARNAVLREPMLRGERDSYEAEKRYLHRDGSPVWVHVTSSVVKDASGHPLHRIAIVQDITDRKRTEQALRESEDRFRHAVEGAPVGIYIQTDGLFRYLNPAALAMYGAETAGQIVGQAVLDRVHPDSRAAVDERIHLVRDERRAAPFLEKRFLRLDGTAFYTEVSANPFSFEGRDGAIVFVCDITERKREENERCALEQQLRQAQKMEAVGRLAGGIAHDFNNLLMVIRSYTEMLQDGLPAQSTFRKHTGEVIKAVDRAASLTGQMLAFSRKQIISPVTLDLNAVIDETAKMLRRLIGEDIEFRVDSAKSLWAIEADSDQIVQVLMNLCVNARDAMPQGGTLTITTANVTVENEAVEDRPYVTPGNYVQLSVADTGTGISKDLQQQIFDPFYTTKEVGKGTGLGLAMVYGIVKQSGGYVWVDSDLGQGACFMVYWPKGKETIIPDMPAQVEAPPRGTGTILVVEDEETLREAVCDYLSGLGYTVLAAGSGKEALSVSSQHEGHVDLLVTDLVMPGMSGRELSQALIRLRSDLKMIFISGYTDDAVSRHGSHEMGAAFLQKPFSLGRLGRKVRDTLGQRLCVCPQ